MEVTLYTALIEFSFISESYSIWTFIHIPQVRDKLYSKRTTESGETKK
jgi:hypothetical protein